MGRSNNAIGTETLVFKLIPLIFAIPLTLRVFELTPDFIVDAINFINIESLFYAGMLYVMMFVSLVEMNFARNDGGTFVESMNAGASIMLALSITGLILGSYVLMTQYAFNGDLDTTGRIISWFMMLEVFVLVIGARLEIKDKVRWGFAKRLKNFSPM